MRDGDIIGRFEGLANAVTSDVTRLQRTISLVRTRQDAFERLLLGNRFGLLRMILFQIIAPSYVRKLMNSAHADEIAQLESVRKSAASQRSQIMTPPRPPLVVA